MKRRAFLRTGAQATALLFVRPAWGSEAPERNSREEENLQQTKQLIERHRQGEGVILVLNAQGKPIPGARVRVEQSQHDFLFGCNFFMFDRCGSPEREEAYGRRFAEVFNYCTLGFYWASYEAERGRPNYEYTDKVADWTRAHAIACKGHPLVWDHPAGSPKWLPDDPNEIERLSLGRVREIVARFKDRIDIWDVVNEATHLPDGVNKTKMARWGASIGNVQYVTEHLRVAREANPRAQLVVNDYRTDPPYRHLLEGLRPAGKFLFDVIGIQSHMHDGVWPLEKVRGICDRYGELGRPIHFTETTIVSGPKAGESWGPTTREGEVTQAEKTAQFYTTLFAHPAVEAITWWDFADLGAWQHASAGWLRSDMSPKPVYERLKSLIKKEWWTNTEGRTNERGELNARAFYGRHRITVDVTGNPPATQDAHWRQGERNLFRFSSQ